MFVHAHAPGVFLSSTGMRQRAYLSLFVLEKNCSLDSKSGAVLACPPFTLLAVRHSVFLSHSPRDSYQALGVAFLTKNHRTLLQREMDRERVREEGERERCQGANDEQLQRQEMASVFCRAISLAPRPRPAGSGEHGCAHALARATAVRDGNAPAKLRNDGPKRRSHQLSEARRSSRAETRTRQGGQMTPSLFRTKFTRI